MSRKMAEFGSWRSPITSEFIVGGNCKSICELQVRNGRVFWTEQTFPDGVKVLFEQDESSPNPSHRGVQWSPDGVSVSTRVHEYGGGSFYVSDSAPNVYISHNGAVYELPSQLSPLRPVTQYPTGKDIRHADLFAHGKFIFAVQERHAAEEVGIAEPQNLLVRVDAESGEVAAISEGADFYAEPRVSPSGKLLAWIQWNKPYMVGYSIRIMMPWDRTSVHLADIGTDGLLSNARKLLDGASHFGLQWSPREPSVLHVISGAIGCNLFPIDADIGGPLWVFGDDRPFALSKSHVVMAVEGELWHKCLDGSATASYQQVQAASDAGFTVISQLTITDDSRLFAIASGPKRSSSIIAVELDTLKLSVVREARDSVLLDELDLSIGRLMSFKSGGVKVNGYFYPPTNSAYNAPDGKLPPVIFFAHPGPTMQTTDALDIKKQYFTSKGFAIFDVNYRGSTGSGRDFRNLLLDNWGIVDTEDIVNGAKHLVEQRLVDPHKLCIIGSSAGGFLALSALLHPEAKFAAAVSIYGVTDLEDIVKATHKFEADYTIRLIAPYPEGIDEYKRRSPIHNIAKVHTPVAFIHGIDDPVVCYKQSVAFYEALKGKGITTALKLFPGESHGFRSAEAVTKSMDISYAFFCRVLDIESTVEADVEIVN